MITKQLAYEKLYSSLIDLKILNAAFESIEDIYEWPLSEAHRNINESISLIEDAIIKINESGKEDA